jgi:hypothetical protein
MGRRARRPGTGMTVVLSVALVAAGAGVTCGPATRCGEDHPAALTERFALHSDPLVNLHHFLGSWASSDLGSPSNRPRVSGMERAIRATFAAEDRERWDAALLLYGEMETAPRSHAEALDLLREESGRLRGEAADLDGMRPGTFETLESVMDLYCGHWWPAHARANQEWLDEVAPILDRHEEVFVEATERLYGSVWPQDPWRIDISAYAPFVGYASQRGAIVIHSTDALNAGLGGVETIFHELQHTRAISATFAARFEEASRRSAESLTAEIGHALIYATAGEVTRRIALLEEAPDHAPFWVRQDFERLPMWAELLPAIEVHWLPAVRGDRPVDEALDDLIRALER